jgi:hypothetical protein
MGSEAEIKIGTAGSLGRTTGLGTCCRLSSGSNYTSITSFAGTATVLFVQPWYIDVKLTVAGILNMGFH